MFSTMRSVRAEIVRKGLTSSAATKRTEEKVRLRWTRKPARETRALPGTGSLFCRRERRRGRDNVIGEK